LDACVSNCGLPFHLEIASRDFEQEFHKLLHKTPERTVRDKLLSCLQKWAENEFKSDPQLHLIPSMYSKLKSSGVEFPASSPSSKVSRNSGG
jgi:signal transducing adaptor molecule